MIWLQKLVVLCSVILLIVACKSETKPIGKVKEVTNQRSIQQIDINTLDPIKDPKKWLSDYGFFQLPLQNMKPMNRVLEYKPRSVLFSDYAEKSRFVWIPEGVEVQVSDDLVGTFDFPDGSLLIKNFYYSQFGPVGSEQNHIIETRLLVKNKDVWEAYPYIWNKEQTDAKLRLIGKVIPVEFTLDEGRHLEFDYIQPNKNQCKSCHNKDEKLVPIGPNARNLNFAFTYDSGKTENQLLEWQRNGYLSLKKEADQYPDIVDSDDPHQPIDKRAKAYLDINCGICHHKDAPASTSGLYLTYETENQSKLGVFKTPVAAGKGAGTYTYDIHPGKADSSILVYRMQSSEVGVQMPEVGRVVAHTEGLEIIKEWINAMSEE